VSSSYRFNQFMPPGHLIDTMMPGATESTIEAVDDRLRQRFPDDYRTFLRSENGLDKWFGDVYLSLYTIEHVVGLNEIHERLAYQPEPIHIGSDGGGEAGRLRLQTGPTNRDPGQPWSEAILQA
jgi:cell wall assembly regulator SMI1